MAKKGQPTRRKQAEIERDLEMLRDRVYGGLTNADLSQRYGLSPSHISRRLSREPLKSIAESWTREMFARHMEMGDVALRATLKLLSDADPYTVNQYWKRMGVSREPTVSVEVQELKFEVPPSVAEVLRLAQENPPADDGDAT